MSRRDREWLYRAYCSGTDPNVWVNEHPNNAETKMLKAICGECTVKTECLEYAMDFGFPMGVWGGLTAPERARLAKSRKP